MNPENFERGSALRSFKYLDIGTFSSEEHYGVMFDDGVCVAWAMSSSGVYDTVFQLKGRGVEALETFYEISRENVEWDNWSVPAVKPFRLVRNKDVTGVSGEGVVAEGVVFPDGSAVIRWCVGPAASTVIWGSTDEAMQVHGHDGATVLEWIKPVGSVDTGVVEVADGSPQEV